MLNTVSNLGRRVRQGLVLALISMAAIAGAAGTAYAKSDEIFTKRDKAVRGYDVVAYFTEGQPVEGSKEFTTEWKDATWQFASQDNLDRFLANPQAYAPQYGGYCAFALSRGSLVSSDPEAWKIVDGKLYLNYNKRVQRRWEEDIPGHISTADANWPSVLD